MSVLFMYRIFFLTDLAVREVEHVVRFEPVIRGLDLGGVVVGGGRLDLRKFGEVERDGDDDDGEHVHGHPTEGRHGRVHMPGKWWPLYYVPWRLKSKCARKREGGEWLQIWRP